MSKTSVKIKVNNKQSKGLSGIKSIPLFKTLMTVILFSESTLDSDEKGRKTMSYWISSTNAMFSTYSDNKFANAQHKCRSNNSTKNPTIENTNKYKEYQTEYKNVVITKI